MNYQKLFQDIKKKHFPELSHLDIGFEEADHKFFMFANMFTWRRFLNLKKRSPVTYNKEIIKQTPKDALVSAIVHELCHKVQSQEANRFKLVYWYVMIRLYTRFSIKNDVVKKIEIDANVRVVKKGFGKELISLNHSVKKRYGKKWNKIKVFYLSDKEIKNLM